MKAIILTTTLLLFTTSLTAQTKEYTKLYGLYNKGKSTKLLSKANKVKEKYSRNAMPYYFIALANYSLYKQSRINSNLSKAIRNLKKAKGYDSDNTYWKQLEKEFIPLQAIVQHKATYYSTNNKKKALKLCESYHSIYQDSLPEHKGLLTKVPLHNTLASTKSKTPHFNSGSKRDSIRYFADICIGTPYKWAGESLQGFDCSGFVKYLYGKVGIKLPHNANKISYLGKEVSERNAQTGDVVLFGSKSKKGHHASHAGVIYENNGEIKVVHSISKGVHITTDYNAYWKQRVIFIKNIIDYPENNELTQAKKRD
jgi:cell wall-associated NlpC family hydrolase